jgi:di/tricarboxylate transporter
MTVEIGIVLFLLFAAIVLFATEFISVDIITAILLIILIVSHIITPEEAFSGFGSDFIIITASVFVISGAMRESGVLETIGDNLTRIAGKKSYLPLLTVLLVPGIVSAFMSNTTVTALFIPPILAVSRKMNMSPSKLLMPLAYTSILGGTCTLIGTSTNIVVSGYMQKAHMQPLGLFEITPIGLMLFGVGFLYMMTIGKKLVPSRKEAITRDVNLRDYLSEVVVLPGSSLIGQNPHDSLLSQADFDVIKIVRDKRDLWPWEAGYIQENDTLLIEGNISHMITVKETSGIAIKGDVILEDQLTTRHVKLAELLVTPGSPLLEEPIRRLNIRQKYGVVIMAVHRMNEPLQDKIGKIKLEVGDVVLVQGPEEQVTRLSGSGLGTVLDEISPVLHHRKRGMLTVSFFLFAIIAGATGAVPLSVCFMGAALMSVLLKSISPEKAYESIDWRLLVLMGGMTAFGTAMEKTGASSYVANLIVEHLQGLGVMAIVAGFLAVTILFTQPMSNAAAALVVLPVAFQTADQLGLNPRTLGIMIMLAASISIITPFEPSCILVYGPGRYRFMDFIKVGLPLTIILAAIILVVTPYFFNLYVK